MKKMTAAPTSEARIINKFRRCLIISLTASSSKPPKLSDDDSNTEGDVSMPASSQLIVNSLPRRTALTCFDIGIISTASGFMFLKLSSRRMLDTFFFSAGGGSASFDAAVYAMKASIVSSVGRKPSGYARVNI